MEFVRRGLADDVIAMRRCLTRIKHSVVRSCSNCSFHSLHQFPEPCLDNDFADEEDIVERQFSFGRILPFL